MKIYFNILLLLLVQNVFSQISPPGLGDTNAASWYAMGLRQKLDKANKIESMTYVGVGLKSDDDDYNLDSKPAILVLNEEIYHQLNDNWKLSYAASYRKQKEYNLNEFSEKEEIEIQQELRAYARISYSKKVGKFKFTQTARQEFRRFVDDDWKNTENPLQLRTRFKTQIALNIDQAKKHSLSAGAEILFSSSIDNATKEWSKFQYKESRFTAAYTFRPKKLPIALSAGYMNNLIETHKTHAVHYASVDLVWENPFKLFSEN